MSDKKFDFARRLADLAAELDDRKQELIPTAQSAATVCINNMHAIAEYVAGERVGELYDRTPDKPQCIVCRTTEAVYYRGPSYGYRCLNPACGV